MMRSNPVNSFFFLFKTGLISQAFLLATIPVILAKYSPESFGVFTMLISLSTIIGVVSSLKIERALVIEERFRVYPLLKLCLASTVFFSLFCYGVLSVFMRSAMNADRITSNLPIFAAIYCFSFGVAQILSHVAMRENQTSIIGMSDALFGSAVFFLVLLLPVDGSGSERLFGIYLFSKGVSLIPFFCLERDCWGSSSFRKLPELALLRNYVKPVATTLLSTLQFRGIYFLSGVQFGDVATGHIALAHRVTYAPINLVGSALRRAYFSEFTAEPDRTDMLNRHVSVVLSYGTLVLCCFAPLLHLAIDWGTSLLPTDWRAAASYFLILYPAASILILLSWLDRVYDANLKQGAALRYEAAYTAILYTVLIFLSGRLGVKPFLVAYMLITVAYNIYWAEKTRQLLGFRRKTVLILASGHVFLAFFCIAMI